MKFDIDYIAPIDGHNIEELVKAFKADKKIEGTCVIHVITKKGKGYKYSEEDTLGLWHSVSPFDIETGKQKSLKEGYTSYIGCVTSYMKEFYKENPNTKVVMPAMTSPSGMNSLKEVMKDDFIDTGITEEFSMSFAASLAHSNNYCLLPIYSSFLMRAYDQLHQDVSMQKEHVVIAVDKAGLVPGNGKTHQGIYDISYLKTIPGLKIVAPKDYTETYKLLDYAFKVSKSPLAIHLPVTPIKIEDININSEPISETWEYINNIDNPKAYMITYSNLVDYVKDEMKELGVEVINARFISPMDLNMLDEISKTNKPIIVYEEAIKSDALGSMIINYYNSLNINKHIYSYGLPLDFIDIGTIEELRCDYKIDKDSIVKEVKKIICD